MDIKEKIQQKIDAQNNARADADERFCIIYRGICPDCAGDLAETSSLLNNIFLGARKFKCKDCGRVHVLEAEGY